LYSSSSLASVLIFSSKRIPKFAELSFDIPAASNLIG
jgi:hypothetical protein